jgi:hypothetical protein
LFCRPQALQKQAEATPLPGSTPKTALKFSTFIQSAKIVVLDQKTAAPSESIVWDAEKATEACDAFEVKRCGDADTKVQVQLTLGSSPDRFQLSAALAALLGITIESRMYIIASLWQVGRPRLTFAPCAPCTGDATSPWCMRVIANGALPWVLTGC